MKFLSICSGIEAASAAWAPLGWDAVGFSEIEPFPSAVLKHHYPNVPNRGDMTKFMEWPDATIDVLCGGTPCQSFSVAGLRKGLDDPRGNLMLTFLAIAKRYRPTWVVWENVPGVLSSNGGRDFGSFLGGLAECGYGFAYRVLDAQYFGLAQRRKRVFVVGYLGDWRRAAAVLFEQHSLQGHPAPSREARKRLAPSVTSGPPFSRTGNDRVEADAMVPITSMCLNAGGMKRQDSESETLLPVAFSIMPMNSGKDYKAREVDVAQPLMAAGPVGGNQGGDFIAQPVAFHPTQDPISSTDVCHSIGTGNGQGCATAAVAFDSMNQAWSEHVTHTLRVGRAADELPMTLSTMQVRRLTPVECERLQGFPDGYTAIPWRNKPASECPDGPRYKALGNSWAVPVVRWIGERIMGVNEISPTRT